MPAQRFQAACWPLASQARDGPGHAAFIRRAPASRSAAPACRARRTARRSSARSWQALAAGRRSACAAGLGSTRVTGCRNRQVAVRGRRKRRRIAVGRGCGWCPGRRCGLASRAAGQAGAVVIDLVGGQQPHIAGLVERAPSGFGRRPSWLATLLLCSVLGRRSRRRFAAASGSASGQGGRRPAIPGRSLRRRPGGPRPEPA